MKNKQILTAALNKNPSSIIDSFNRKLSEKILKNIEVKKAESGANFFRKFTNNK